MKTVLLPTDLSAKSRNAVDYALELFSGQEVRFFLLNAYRLRDYPTEITIGAIQGQLGIEPRKALRTLAIQLQNAPASTGRSTPSFNTFVEFGDTQQVISDFANAHDVDFIVMGEKGRDNYFKKWFGGGNTRRISQKVQCPLITVPCGLQFRKPEKILLLTSLTKVPSRDKLAPVLALSQQFGASVTVLNILPDATANLLEKDQEVFENLFGPGACQLSMLPESKLEAALTYYAPESHFLAVVQDGSNNPYSKKLQQRLDQLGGLFQELPTLKFNL